MLKRHLVKERIDSVQLAHGIQPHRVLVVAVNVIERVKRLLELPCRQVNLALLVTLWHQTAKQTVRPLTLHVYATEPQQHEYLHLQ